MPAVCQASYATFSEPTSIATQMNVPTAISSAAMPAYIIVVPWLCVDFPSGLKRWRVPVTTPRKTVWTSIARDPS